MGKGTTPSSLLDWTLWGKGGKDVLPERLPQNGSPLGIPLYPVAQNGFLPQVWQAFGECNWAGVSLGLTQLPSLPMDTRASELWAQEAMRERGDELSAETGQQGEILGSSGGLCIQLV